MQKQITGDDGLTDRERARRAKQRAESLTARGLPEPLGVSIAVAAALTSESEWQVKQRLRKGDYAAKKAGRRTLVVYESIKEFWAALPAAKFMPPKRRADADAA